MALKAKKVQEKVKSVRKESTKDKKKTRASESKHAKVATTEKVVPVTKDSKKDKKVKDKSERKRPVVEVPKAEKKSKKDDAKTQEKHQVMEKESKKKKKSVDDQKTCANQQNTKNAAVASQEGGGGPSAGTAVAPLTLPIPPRRVSFKSPPSTVVSETPSPRKTLFPSPDASPALSLDNLQVWKVEASKKGMSLEEYMEEISRTNFDQSVERHMRALMAEQQQDAEAAHEPSMPLPGTPGAPVASHESSMPLPGTSLAVPETQLAKKEKENNEVEKEDNDSDSLSSASMADSDSSDSDDGEGNDEPDNEDEQESKSEDDDDEEEEEEPVDMQALESEIDKMIEPEKTKPEETKTAPSLKPAESTQADNATKVQEAVSQQLALKDEKATEFAKANSNLNLTL